MGTLLYRIGRTAYMHKWPFIIVWLLLLAAMGVGAFFLHTPTSSSFTIPGLPSLSTQAILEEEFPTTVTSAEAPSGTLVITSKDGLPLDNPSHQATIKELISTLKDTGEFTALDMMEDPATQAAVIEQTMRSAISDAEQTATEKLNSAQAQVDELTAFSPEAGQKAQQQLDAAKESGLAQLQAAKDALPRNLAEVTPLSEDKLTGTVPLVFNYPTVSDLPESVRSDFETLVNSYTSDSLEFSYMGTAFGMTAPNSGTSELIGIGVAALVLVITFGALVVAGVPLLTALVGVGIGNLGVLALTGLTDTVNESTPMLASMLGLAVGIDYALFIVSRYKHELSILEVSPTADAFERRSWRSFAAGRAVGTAGSAVVFAGLTVVVALCALAVVDIPFLTTMALTAAGTVVIAVLVALTLLPAILGLFGPHVFKGRIPVLKAPDPEGDSKTMGLSWVTLIGKAPWVFLIATIALLAALAVPMKDMHLALPTDASSAPGTPQRIAYEKVEEAFGPGRNAPLIALIDQSGVNVPNRQRVSSKIVDDLNAIPGVKNAMIAEQSQDSKYVMVLIEPTTGSLDPATTATMKAVRDYGKGQEYDTGAILGLSGITAIQTDISAKLDSVLIPYVAIVLVLAFLILTLVFRSFLVPLIAACGFALTVCATFGLTVSVFGKGWLGFIDDPQPLVSFLPIILIGIVFGLAMDYQVFLVSRMREGWVLGKGARWSTINVFKHGARVVTAAALIMISVFAAFILQDLQVIKTMGFALAVAVFIDAFIVRMTLIPATMFILGRYAWWLPRGIDRFIPGVDIEGHSMEDTVDQNNSVSKTAPPTPLEGSNA